MLRELDAALDRAAADEAVVVLTGRDSRFSGGFDLAELRVGGPDASAMLRAGFELAVRILSFPLPVVVACNGHAIAMGVFLLLSADSRIGTEGPYKITANEVSIGLTMPRAALEICRYRLAPADFDRAVTLAEVYSPGDAVAAGFLDRVVPAGELHAASRQRAEALRVLDMPAHAATKLRARADALRVLREAIDSEFAAVPTT